MLNDFREKIDTIDAELVSKLAERFEVTRRLGEYKKREDMPAQDVDREEENIVKLRVLAREQEIDEQLVEDVWRLIMKRVVEEHKSTNKD